MFQTTLLIKKKWKNQKTLKKTAEKNIQKKCKRFWARFLAKPTTRNSEIHSKSRFPFWGRIRLLRAVLYNLRWLSSKNSIYLQWKRHRKKIMVPRISWSPPIGYGYWGKCWHLCKVLQLYLWPFMKSHNLLMDNTTASLFTSPRHQDIVAKARYTFFKFFSFFFSFFSFFFPVFFPNFQALFPIFRPYFPFCRPYFRCSALIFDVQALFSFFLHFFSIFFFWFCSEFSGLIF